MHRRVTASWLLSLITLALLAGCSRGPEGAAPTSPATATTVEGPVFLTAPAAPATAPQGMSFTSRFILADRGGDLTLGSVTVDFPRGSLPHNTVVSMSALGGGLVGVQIQPAGMVLLKPALVKVDRLDRTNEKALQTPLARLRQHTGSIPMVTRRSGAKIEGDLLLLGEVRIGSEKAASTEIQWLYYLDGPGYSSALITPDQGGKVTCGRYQVTLPPGALAAETYITVRDPGNRFVSCELEPHGIQFLAPVELQIDLHGLRYSPYTGWTVYWLAAPDQWQDQGGTFADEKVRANLWHFSTYAPADGGRAGW